MPAPLWNTRVLTNNQRMYHRGEANRPRDRRTLPGPRLDSVIEAADDDGWMVRNGDDVIGRYTSTDTRVLFHYSALVFDDLADAKRYLDHNDDLTTERAGVAHRRADGPADRHRVHRAAQRALHDGSAELSA